MQDSITDFINYLATEKRCSEHTVKAYRRDLESFHGFLWSEFQTNDLHQVKQRYIRSWLVELKSSGIASRSVNRKLSSLRSYFRFLQRQQLIDFNPCAAIQSLRTEKTLPSDLRPGEVEQLLDRPPSNRYSELRDALIIDVFYALGLRRQELISVQVSDIDFERELLRVFGKGSKVRLLPVPTVLLNSLQDHVKLRTEHFPDCDHDFLFCTDKGRPLYPKFVYNLVRAALTHVSTQKKRSPHILRHTFATHLSNNGADIKAVKELLGHASLAATQIYTHTSTEKLLKAYRKAHPKGSEE